SWSAADYCAGHKFKSTGWDSVRLDSDAGNTRERLQHGDAQLPFGDIHTAGDWPNRYIRNITLAGADSSQQVHDHSRSTVEHRPGRCDPRRISNSSEPR